MAMHPDLSGYPPYGSSIAKPILRSTGLGRTTKMSVHAQTEHLRTCGRCGIRYDWRKSPSTSLKMTYCGALCEMAALGFTIEAMLRSAVEVLPAPQPLSETWLIAA